MKLPEKSPRRAYRYIGKGPFRIPMYLDRQGKYQYFKIAWRPPGEKKRKVEKFPTEEKAERRANEVREIMLSGVVGSRPLERCEVQEYLDCKQIAGNRMRLVLTEDQEARRILGHDVSKITLAEFYSARHQSITAKSVQDVVEQYLQSKQTKVGPGRGDGITQKYVDELDRFFSRFAGTFRCEIGALRAPELATFLSTPNPSRSKHRNAVDRLAAASFNSYRLFLQDFFRFAVRKKYLPSDWSLLEEEELKLRPVPHREPVIYSPSELRRLLYSCPKDPKIMGGLCGRQYAPGSHADLLLFLCIGAFSGIRSEEISRLQWEHIHDDHIEVLCPNSKTGQHRDVPMWPVLQAWLAPYRKESGPIFKLLLQGIQQRFGKLVASVGIAKRPRNALRKGYASYRVAETGDFAKICSETGHRRETLLSYYRKKVRPEMAKEWFSIFPPESATGNITYLNAVG